MVETSIRVNRSSSVRNFLNQRCKTVNETELKKRAIVFIPHQDDETLGCGATIYKKIKAGADLFIVFLTDGSRSHSKFLDEADVKALRHEEALAATKILGLSENKIIFLDYHQSKFITFHDDAVDNVKRIIDEISPEQIYMPFFQDVHPDHIETNRIVKEALKSLGKAVSVFEFPIWFWSHWPWIGIDIKVSRVFLTEFRKAASFGFGLSAFNCFKTSVYVADALQKKREALNAYKSQMTKMNSKKDWPTLGEVACGDFLDCFFYEHEVFYQYGFSV